MSVHRQASERYSASDFEKVRSIINRYFQGLYTGNVDDLNTLFQDDTWLITPNGRRSKYQWLRDVEGRATPVERQQSYDFEILSVDIVKNQAMVKVYCPLFEFKYIDFLGLIKTEGEWLIVSKMYTDILEGST